MIDETLFDKLATGAAWWNIQHSARAKWEQQHYDNPKPTTPEEVWPKVPPAAPKVACVREAPRPVQGTPVLQRILEEIDPYVTLYTKEQNADALELVRTRMLAFVTGLAHPYFGPKKSRILSSWLSNNKVGEDSGPIIRGFLTFLFGSKFETSNVVLGPRHTWMIAPKL
jgi:hypothetical protein